MVDGEPLTDLRADTDLSASSNAAAASFTSLILRYNSDRLIHSPTL